MRFGNSELLRQHLAEQHEAYRHGIARWVREAVAEGDAKDGASPEGIALQYISVVFGLIFQWLVHSNVIDIMRGLHDQRENILEVVKGDP